MIGQQFVTTNAYADSQVDVDREVLMHISTDQPVFVQIARINHRDGSRIWEQSDTPFPASDFVFDRCAGVRFKTNGATPANVYVIWTFHLDDVLIRRFSTNGPFVDVDNFVTSVFGRTGDVVAVNGDYEGIVASALAGATAPTRYVGGTVSGAPVAGTFAAGDFIVAEDGNIWVCRIAGSPGTWKNVGSNANLVTSVFGRTGAVVAAANDYSAAQVTSAADKSSLSAQNFTAEVGAKDFSPAGLTGAQATTRYVGATASGAPVTGTFSTGDYVIAQDGSVWICLNGGSPGSWGAISPQKVAAIASSVNNAPTGTISASTVMMGIGLTITPLSSRIFVLGYGVYRSSSTSATTRIDLRRGTGSAPTNGAAATGTTIGAPLQTLLTGNTGRNIPFSIAGIVTGLTPGTTYWLDFGLQADGNNSVMGNASIIAHDIF
jgi:hypothetical protein